MKTSYRLTFEDCIRALNFTVQVINLPNGLVKVVLRSGEGWVIHIDRQGQMIDVTCTDCNEKEAVMGLITLVSGQALGVRGMLPRTVVFPKFVWGE